MASDSKSSIIFDVVHIQGCRYTTAIAINIDGEGVGSVEVGFADKFWAVMGK